jgi:hypothetical protein
VPERDQAFVRSRLVLAPGSSMSSMKASDHNCLNLVLDRVDGGLRERVRMSENSPPEQGSMLQG